MSGLDLGPLLSLGLSQMSALPGVGPLNGLLGLLPNQRLVIPDDARLVGFPTINRMTRLKLQAKQRWE